jgi:hypothetical protein
MVCQWYYFKRLERGFGHSNLAFDADILAFSDSATVLATFCKIWVIFPQSFGHSGQD